MSTVKRAVALLRARNTRTRCEALLLDELESCDTIVESSAWDGSIVDARALASTFGVRRQIEMDRRTRTGFHLWSGMTALVQALEAIPETRVAICSIATRERLYIVFHREEDGPALVAVICSEWRDQERAKESSSC